MARSNQPPKPECCRAEGQVQVPEQGAEDQTTARKRTQGDSQAASESRTSLKQFSPETILQRAGGDAVASAEPNTEMNATGEFVGDLPGSQSVAPGARGRQNDATCKGNQRRKNDGIKLANLPAGYNQQGSARTQAPVWRTLPAAQPGESPGVLLRLAQGCGSGSGRNDLQGIRKEPGKQSVRPGEAAQEQELSRSTGASKVHPQGERKTQALGHPNAGGKAGAKCSSPNPLGQLRSRLPGVQLRLSARTQSAPSGARPDRCATPRAVRVRSRGRHQR